jgi:hypothetical protein
MVSEFGPILNNDTRVEQCWESIKDTAGANPNPHPPQAPPVPQHGQTKAQARRGRRGDSNHTHPLTQPSPSLLGFVNDVEWRRAETLELNGHAPGKRTFFPVFRATLVELLATAEVEEAAIMEGVTLTLNLTLYPNPAWEAKAKAAPHTYSRQPHSLSAHNVLGTLTLP